MKNVCSGLVAMGIVCALAAPVWAVPTFYIIQKDALFTQSGPSTVSPVGFQFLARATPNDGASPINFNAGTVSFPAASPLATTALTPLGGAGSELRYSSGVVNQTTYQTDYPDGNYNFHLTNSSPSATEDATVTVDSVTATPPPTSIPALTAASFNALQGMDPTKPFTMNWNSFTGANSTALIFLFVTDASNNIVFFDGPQPNVTQDTIPANTLQLGHTYGYKLFFSNTTVGPLVSSDGVQGEVLQDNRTSGSFATVPEPSSAALCLLGLGGVALRRKRR
jgi:hypothetical protein